jgi:hypothetical protein
VVVPDGHPLARVKPLTLEAIAQYPLVTYDRPSRAAPPIDRTFARAALPGGGAHRLDSDVIKSYVPLGLGVGIISSRAFRRARTRGCGRSTATTSSPRRPRGSRTSAALPAHYTVEFIRLFAPHVRGADLKQLEVAAGENFSI